MSSEAGTEPIKRECKHHGETTFIYEKRGAYRCRQCRIERVTAQRQKNKRTLVKEHGGKCQKCGYNKSIRALHFHHLDPSGKLHGISQSGRTFGIDRLRAEAQKCVLLCANCHSEVEDGLWDASELKQNSTVG